MAVTTWKDLPDVLIQDALNDVAYVVPATELRKHPAGPETWTKLDDRTVTFVIPSPRRSSKTLEVPPFITGKQVKEPSVLLQHEHSKQSFFLTWKELLKFKTKTPAKHPARTISFVLPVGLDLIQRVDTWCTRCLQAGTGSEHDGE